MTASSRPCACSSRAAAYYGGDGPAVAKNPVARHTPPSSEVARFHTRQSLSFPASEVSGIEARKSLTGTRQWHVHVDFMGLTGSSGILPYHYSELVLKRLKIKDKSMMDFLDLFNHRLISLFFQASVKYRLPLEHERRKLGSAPGADGDTHTRLLMALIGLGTNGLNRRLYTRDESLLYYSGLLTSKVRTAAGLRQIIFNHFRIPVEIREFIGQWQELIDDVRTRLPGPASPRGQNNQLGRSVMLGRKGWFSQGKIRIILGPLTTRQLSTFAPGTPTLKALNEIVRLYVNFEHDYEFIMRIARADIPDTARLLTGQAAGPWLEHLDGGEQGPVPGRPS
ncbi:MAG: type VI secretion system baseplate subunit TssG [Chromatiales bacterium]|nr:type VI secretion system baseplate subunit TssG [Chromatiales bacterium]